jgi:hypothetical protein
MKQSNVIMEVAFHLSCLMELVLIIQESVRR